MKTIKSAGVPFATQRTDADGDVEGFSWASQDMSPELCARVGIASEMPMDILKAIMLDAWQANNRHFYVAARSELARRKSHES